MFFDQRTDLLEAGALARKTGVRQTGFERLGLKEILAYSDVSK